MDRFPHDCRAGLRPARVLILLSFLNAEIAEKGEMQDPRFKMQKLSSCNLHPVSCFPHRALRLCASARDLRGDPVGRPYNAPIPILPRRILATLFAAAILLSYCRRHIRTHFS
jgi:hypothetical protein